MAISEKRIKRMDNMVCVQQYRKAIRDKIALRELDLSERTIKDYCVEIDLFFRQIGIPHDQQPTIEQCLEWKEKHIDRYSKKAMGKKITAINLYLKLVCGYQQSMPQIKHITRAKKPIVLSREQIMNMVDLAESKGKYTMATMIFTAFITACRKSVLFELKLSDLDFERNIITLRGCKGDHDLNVPMATTDMQRIKKYIDIYRPKPAKGHENYVFLGKNGKKTYDQKLRRALQYCAEKCNIREKIHPHTLRHSRVKDLRVQGYTWEQIMTITGHANINSLSSYIHEEDFDTVQEKLNGDYKQSPSKQNDDSNTQRELEILRLRLQLEQKKNENLQMELQLNNHEIQPTSLNTDHEKGYV